MDEFFGLIVIVIVLCVVASANKKKRAAQKKRPTTIASRIEAAEKAEYGSAQQASAAAEQAAKNARKVSSLYERRRPSSPDAVCDSKDDWLSQQLKEEKRALREVSAMFQLKASHETSCDAEELKRISRH